MLEGFMPSWVTGGRQRDTDLRMVVDTILYLLRSGGSWRMLPKDFPPYTTVYEYWSRWRKDGTLIRIHDALRRQVREQAGKEAEPSAAIIDSQSVKTTEVPGVRGYDAGKKVKGRKRHLLVDTLGMLLLVVVHSAGIQDRDGAKKTNRTPNNTFQAHWGFGRAEDFRLSTLDFRLSTLENNKVLLLWPRAD